ncbi:MAG: hypothetical protein HYY17_14235 [Planctomycetes bacterium]|nr:hypothetical protein [Planctomycetota bacterium]
MILLTTILMACQEDTGEQFYKFKTGTLWVYERTEGPRKGKTTFTVTKEEKGKVYVDSVEEWEGTDEATKDQMVWSIEDGCLVWNQLKDDKTALLFSPYKTGSKKGDTWRFSSQVLSGWWDMTHQGSGEVDVPAGKYKDVVHLQGKPRIVDDVSLKQVDFHFAAGVGLLKLEVVTPEGKSSTVLKQFKPAD